MDSFDREILFIYIFAFCVLFLPLFGAVRFVLADDKVDYCTMEAKRNYTTSGLEQTWLVKGSVEWRTDVVVAEVPSIEVALLLMRSPACGQ